MVNKANFDEIKKQSDFCRELMVRLDLEIKSSANGMWSGMENHIRKQDDIKRLRRELMTLSHMLNPWEG